MFCPSISAHRLQGDAFFPRDSQMPYEKPLKILNFSQHSLHVMSGFLHPKICLPPKPGSRTTYVYPLESISFLLRTLPQRESRLCWWRVKKSPVTGQLFTWSAKTPPLALRYDSQYSVNCSRNPCFDMSERGYESLRQSYPKAQKDCYTANTNIRSYTYWS